MNTSTLARENSGVREYSTDKDKQTTTVYVYKQFNDAYAYGEEDIKIYASKAAAKALDDLYKFVGQERDEITEVFVSDLDFEIGREYIQVKIGSAVYGVNVECNSVPAIIKEVVDKTICKI